MRSPGGVCEASLLFWRSSHFRTSFFGGAQGDVRTSSLELRPGGSRVGETGGQWPLPSSPSAESGTLAFRVSFCS